MVHRHTVADAAQVPSSFIKSELMKNSGLKLDNLNGASALPLRRYPSSFKCMAFVCCRFLHPQKKYTPTQNYSLNEKQLHLQQFRSVQKQDDSS